MKGFFPESELASRKTTLGMVAQCGACGLYKSCMSPKIPVWGNGSKGIFIIGEAPGRQEDLENKPFCGKAGVLLQETLREFGINFKRDCWVSNSLICRPKNNLIEDKKSIDYCRPNVVKAISERDPVAMILLGKNAVESVIGWVWREGGIGGVNKWAGWQIPCQKPINAWIIPTWHPSHILRAEKDRNYVPLLRKWKEHLGNGISKTSKPWKEIPNYQKEIKVLYSQEEVSKQIKEIIKENIPTAFDYETDRLKPDSKNSKIVCCGLSNGKRTIAYPWIGSNIQATKEFLESSTPKICANAKFELRWTKAVLDTQVNNLLWDTMLATHVLDNRPEICSLKFQAFVQLGAESYDERIKPWLKPKEKGSSSNSQNQIKEISFDKLLYYCGHDALLEYKLAMIQMEQLK